MNRAWNKNPSLSIDGNSFMVIRHRSSNRRNPRNKKQQQKQKQAALRHIPHQRIALYLFFFLYLSWMLCMQMKIWVFLKDCIFDSFKKQSEKRSRLGRVYNWKLDNVMELWSFYLWISYVCECKENWATAFITTLEEWTVMWGPSSCLCGLVIS